MQQLHTELSDSKQRVDKLQSELSDSKQRVEQLQSELSDSKQRVDQLHTELSDSKQRVDKLHTELSDSKQRVDKLQSELSDSKQRVNQLHTELSDSKQRVDQLESELSDSKQRVDQLQSELSDSKQRVDQLQSELSDSKQRVDQLQSELSDSKQRVDQLESELSDSKQRVDQLESQLIKLQDNKTLAAQLQSLNVQVDYKLHTQQVSSSHKLHIPYSYCKLKNFAVVASNSLENIHGCMVILYGQTLLHRLLHWKSFVVIDRSTKTAKLFHLEQFAIYGIATIAILHTMCRNKYHMWIMIYFIYVLLPPMTFLPVTVLKSFYSK